MPPFFFVTYRLSFTGLSDVSQVTYIDDLRVRRTVNSPPDGWNVAFDLPQGRPVGSTAEGIVRDGEIVLEIVILGETGSDTRSDSCSDSSGAEVPCSLEIPQAPL